MKSLYERMRERFGHRRWWPGDTPLEIIIGAILTQNTAWINVEKAISNLKREEALSIDFLRVVDVEILAEWLRPSGYYNQKAKKIKNFIAFLDEHYQGSLEEMARAPLEILRMELLKVNGIGPETADSILLYALEKTIFVVDAYTRRILSRHFYLGENPTYSETQNLLHNELNGDTGLYNDFHAQFVATGNRYCKPKPRCAGCPLEDLPRNINQGDKR